MRINVNVGRHKPRSGVAGNPKRRQRCADAGLHLCALLVATLALTGCGYHLQRARNLPPVMQRTVIVGANPYGTLVRELTRALSGTNIQVVQSTAIATAQLHILRDDAGQRVSSVDSKDRPQAYELHYAIAFSVTHKGQTLLQPQTVSLTRDYVFDPDNVLAGNQEAQRLLAAMRSDLVQVMLRRLAAVRQPTPNDNPPPARSNDNPPPAGL